jgi:transposase-like protein
MKSVLSDIHFHSEEAAYAYVEARIWPDGPVCPHCGNVDPEKIGPLKGKTTRIGLYKCYACRQPFNVKIGTVFEKSHVPMRVWLQAIYLFASSKKGISTRQLQRTFQCGLKTAWFLGHRVREAMTVLHIDGAGPLGGAGEFVEADETFIGGKEGNKHKSKRTGRGGGQGKAPVLALVERDGRVRSFHPADVTAATLRSVIVKHVDFASHFRTDEAHHYRHIGGLFASHETVAHSQDEYVRGDAHTNTAENFFSILKRGIYGCYFHVSEAHLHRYLAEFDFRHNNRAALGVDDLDRATRALVGAKGKRLTYRTTRGGQA